MRSFSQFTNNQCSFLEFSGAHYFVRASDQCLEGGGFNSENSEKVSEFFRLYIFCLVLPLVSTQYLCFIIDAFIS